MTDSQSNLFPERQPAAEAMPLPQIELTADLLEPGRVEGLKLTVTGAVVGEEGADAQERMMALFREVNETVLAGAAATRGGFRPEVIGASRAAGPMALEMAAEPSRSLTNGGASAATADPTDPKGADDLRWDHDERRHGMPLQSWSGVKKALWVLRVVTDCTPYKEFHVTVLATLFEREFGAAGNLDRSNAKRDLKKKSAGPQAAVKLSGSVVRLLQNGFAETDELIAEAGGRTVVGEPGQPR